MRSVVEFIDARSDHHKSLILQKLQAIDWSTDSLLKIISTLLLTSSIISSMNSSRTAFPLYGSKCHQKTLLLSRLLHLLSKRNKLLRKGMVQEARLLQPRITHLIKENQLNLTKVNNFETITT